jgi:hypothetical protein
MERLINSQRKRKAMTSGRTARRETPGIEEGDDGRKNCAPRNTRRRRRR